MSYYDKYQKAKEIDFTEFFVSVTKRDIRRILAKDNLTEDDFLALLSPVASNFLEEMAEKAHKLTLQNFGRVMLMYLPLYLSNHCVNQCSYCGFNVTNDLTRDKLSLAEIEKEAVAIAEKGIKHLLILTGESRKKSPLSYLKRAINLLKDYFPALSIEIYPLDITEYEELIATGVEGLTIYQEVYNESLYEQVHLSGPKRDYHYRLNAPERGCKAGMRNVNIGPLLGLADWRKEAFFAGLHADYLQRKYLETEISLSLPRLRPHQGNFEIQSVVNDKNLVQIMLAYRLFLPKVGINLSTRESAKLRDNLIQLGVTKLSAESSTAVGGYSKSKEDKQFEIDDKRTVSEIRAMLKQQNYQMIFKNWHWL